VAEHPKNYRPLLQQVASDHRCTELAAFDVEGGPDDFKLLYHVRGRSGAGETERRAAVAAFVDIIRPCVAAKRDGAIRIVEDPPPEHPQYCLVTLAERSGKVVGAAGFIVRCYDDKDAKNLLRCIQ
jgi:hypothetical protein